MPEFLQAYMRVLDIFIPILTGVIIAAVSSWITVQLSLRRFRSERWWERRVEAYERIISALHDSKVYSEAHFQAELERRDVPDDSAEELSARLKSANAGIERAIDTGVFLLPDEALERLKQYRKDVQSAFQLDTAFDFLDADLAATKACLKDLIEIAKRDLKAN